MRARRATALTGPAIALATFVVACSAPPLAVPTQTPIPPAAAPGSSTSAPTVSAIATTAAPRPTIAASPTAVTTATSAAGRADYCRVADVPTPNVDFTRHERTFLDWTYSLGASYVPPDLVDAATGRAAKTSPYAIETIGAADLMARRGDPGYSALLVDAPGAKVRSVVFDALASLRAAASAAGHPVVIVSAYRSYDVQAQTFDYWTRVGGYEQALRTSARAGHSEHQLGTVVDLGDGAAAPWEYDDWAATPAGAWVAAHAADYGFVMSFLAGKSGVTCYSYEPWHYRFVGRALAAVIVSKGIALREYQSQQP